MQGVLLGEGVCRVEEQHLVFRQIHLLAGEALKLTLREDIHHGASLQGNLLGVEGVAHPGGGDVPPLSVHHVFDLDPQGLGFFFYCSANQLLHILVFRLGGHQHVPGIARPQQAVHAGVQGEGGGHRHQQGGEQHADGSQPRGVLLHAEEHAGEGGEVVCLIIEALVLFQQLQHGRDAGDEQQVGAKDDQNHRHKEEHQRGEGVLDGDGHGVARAQQQGPQHRQEPVGLGLPLAGLAAVEQLDGLGELHLQQVVAQGQQEDGPEQPQGGGDGRRRNHKGHGQIRAQQQPQQPE